MTRRFGVRTAVIPVIGVILAGNTAGVNGKRVDVISRLGTAESAKNAKKRESGKLEEGRSEEPANHANRRESIRTANSSALSHVI